MDKDDLTLRSSNACEVGPQRPKVLGDRDFVQLHTKFCFAAINDYYRDLWVTTVERRLLQIHSKEKSPHLLYVNRSPRRLYIYHSVSLDGIPLVI